MKSRFVKIRQARRISHRRSRYLPGAEEDSGRYIRCWNCGFIVDMKKVNLSPSNGIHVYDDPYAENEIHGSGDPLSIIVRLRRMGREFVILENGPDDLPVTDFYTPRTPESVAGCPLCGTTNLP